ncbi:hypothetical protein [Streptomyces sp. NPDC018693]|uniref:hypothetical protein n=1 Tax=unclassified Streptomyces TaxID=2593676 RepID=UPI003789B785
MKNIEAVTLPLDFFDLDSWTGLTKRSSDAFPGVVVDGDLTVSDRVVNGECDFGPFLLMRGDVRAKNIATAGSDVLIEGHLAVDQTIVGTYNHGRTVIHGDTCAEVVYTEEHLIEFHGALAADLVVAGNFLRVADPARAQVGGWVGHVCDLRGEILPQLGSESTRALRPLDPDLWRNPNRRKVMAAVETGRSLLRAPEAPGPRQPGGLAEAVRDVLQQAGCREADLWDGGFWIDDRGDARPLEVSFAEAEEPDDSDDSDESQALDAAAELSRYARVLAAAGFEVAVDPKDEDILTVGR